MTDLNPEQVRYWRTFPYGPQVPRADFRALADSWLAQREALAAAEQALGNVNLTNRSEMAHVIQQVWRRLASLSNNNTND